MKHTLTILAIACLLLLAQSCNSDLRSDYNYRCGKQLTEAELGRFPINNSKPKYNFEALKLLGKISSIVFVANGSSKSYDVQFLNNDRNSLVVQVFGLANEAAIDKTVCEVFAFKEYIFPKETILLFYSSEKSAPNPVITVGLKK